MREGGGVRGKRRSMEGYNCSSGGMIIGFFCKRICEIEDRD